MYYNYIYIYILYRYIEIIGAHRSSSKLPCDLLLGPDLKVATCWQHAHGHVMATSCQVSEFLVAKSLA